MDAVQKFISENSHQFGYIMQEAERQWREKDNVGALAVCATAFEVDKYGDYNAIFEKMKTYEKALETINELAVYYDLKGWALNGEKVGVIAAKALEAGE